MKINRITIYSILGTDVLLGCAALLNRQLAALLHVLSPVCPFYATTGLYCPSCKGTRAFLSLFQGHYVQAIQYNWLMMFFAALGAVALLACNVWIITRSKHLYRFVIRPIFSPYTAGVLVGLIVLYFVITNFL